MIFKTLSVSSETTQWPLSFNDPLQITHCVLHQVNQKLPSKSKMQMYFITAFLSTLCMVVTIDLMSELKKNILNFGYGANFKYEGMLTPSFDRFYIVTKYEIPRVEQLQLTTFAFDLMCSNLNISKSPLLMYIKHCRRIAPYVKFYKQQIDYYNQTAYNLLQNKIGLILPNFNSRKKRFLTTILGTIATKVIGLAFEGISSFLHHKRHKALQKAINALNSRTNIDHNRWKVKIFVSEMNGLNSG